MIDPNQMTSAAWPINSQSVATNRQAAAPAASRTSGFLQELGKAYSRIMARPSPTRGEAGESTSDTKGATSIASSIRAIVPHGSLRDLVVAAARQEGVPPALLAALVQAESGFQPGAVSPAGAKGLTQLMDSTARGLGVTNPFDAWQNLVGGARFLHGLIARYHGNYHLALAAYNAGPGAVDAAHGQIPPYRETQAYVPRVLALYEKFRSEFPE